MFVIKSSHLISHDNVTIQLTWNEAWCRLFREFQSRVRKYDIIRIHDLAKEACYNVFLYFKRSTWLSDIACFLDQSTFQSFLKKVVFTNHGEDSKYLVLVMILVPWYSHIILDSVMAWDYRLGLNLLTKLHYFHRYLRSIYDQMAMPVLLKTSTAALYLWISSSHVDDCGDFQLYRLMSERSLHRLIADDARDSKRSHVTAAELNLLIQMADVTPSKDDLSFQRWAHLFHQVLLKGLNKPNYAEEIIDLRYLCALLLRHVNLKNHPILQSDLVQLMTLKLAIAFYCYEKVPGPFQKFLKYTGSALSLVSKILESQENQYLPITIEFSIGKIS
jgi:hypothetical protein